MWAAPCVEELGVRTLCWCSGFRNNSEGGETKKKGREEWRGMGRENDTNSAAANQYPTFSWWKGPCCSVDL